MNDIILDPLSRLAIRHGTDKYGAHEYTPYYHRIFSPLRDRPVKLLEIGIGGYDSALAGGHGLTMWAEYFPYGHIVGIDIAAKRLQLPPRITTLQGSQTDCDFLDRVCREHGPFDIIIDDGSHVVAHVDASFRYLYPRMAPQGFYVVEDTQTAFWPDVGGSQSGQGTIFELAHKLAVAMHAREVRVRGQEPVETEYGDITASVQIMRNLIVFERGSNTYPSNAAFDLNAPEAQRMLATLSAEAARDPSPGNYLVQLDLAAWARAVDRQVAIAREAAALYPQRVDILLAAIRVMEHANLHTECLALTGQLLALCPADPEVRAMMARRLAEAVS